MPPRLVTISLVRNEADIIETFVRHHAAYTTKMIFVLHRCIDNTEEILRKLQAEGLPLEIHEDPSIAYPQSAALTKCIRAAVKQETLDWILPLDADEFLVPAEGKSLEDSLAALGKDRVHLLPWKTYVPTPEDDVIESNVLRRIIHRRSVEMPQIRKVLLPAELLRTRDWKLPMGCHTLLHRETGTPFPSISTVSISLAHFPVRSSEQLCSKVLGGWLALTATQDRAPASCYQWQALLERCLEARPISMGELRNIALRYATQHGTDTLPTLVRDPVATFAYRPLYAPQNTSPLRVAVDIAGAGTRGAMMMQEETLESLAESLKRPIADLAAALRDHASLPTLNNLPTQDANANALACVAAILSAATSGPFELMGSALTRRQKTAQLLPPMFAPLHWITETLSANKLPHTLERALQEILSIISAADMTALKQRSRTHDASDDVVLQVSQLLTVSQRGIIPSPIAVFMARMLHELLIHSGVTDGLGNGNVYLMDPACGRGEIGCELIRQRVHARMKRGGNPETLRKEMLEHLRMRDTIPALLAVSTARLSRIFTDAGLPLTQTDHIPIDAGATQEVLAHDAAIPILATALVKGSDASHPGKAATNVLQHYLSRVHKYGMDRDTDQSPVLRSMAHIHAVLASSEVSAGGIALPRSVLHCSRFAGLREALLEDFEQLWILDLGGGQPSESDEPVEGSDESGFAILFLVRAPGIRQETHCVSWSGMKIQKYHALLSRAFTDMSWQRIAPQKPGYVLLPLS